jgi:hypothetical protein
VAKKSAAPPKPGTREAIEAELATLCKDLALTEWQKVGLDFQQWLEQDLFEPLGPEAKRNLMWPGYDPRHMVVAFVRLVNSWFPERIKAEQAARPLVRKGGRPKGGAGEQVARRVANGETEDIAIRTMANRLGRSIPSVARAYADWQRAERKRKNSPARASRTKNPR